MKTPKFHDYLTTINLHKVPNKKNEFIVVHYVGATGGAKDNCVWFAGGYRAASAHIFVDHASRGAEYWRCVREEDAAWHCGDNYFGYRHPRCRNSNSIGIEMCCHNRGGKWIIDPLTIQRTAELVAYYMRKYKIPISNVLRHYDVTHKVCPQPMVADPKMWDDFKKMVVQIYNGGSVGSSADRPVSDFPAGAYTIVPTTLKLRTSPGKGSAGILRRGSPVTVNATHRIGRQVWAKIGDGKWICAQNPGKKPYITPKRVTVPSAGRFTAKYTINIREKPSVASTAHDVYRPGESVNYDQMLDRGGYTWISWIGRTSGKRRYMAIRRSTDSDLWGVIDG